MPTEEELFWDDVKPAILYQSVTRKRRAKLLKKHCEAGHSVKIINSTYSNNKSSILVAKNPEQFKEQRLGVLLGYFPKSVDAFDESFENKSDENEVSMFINYGGISFNTAGFFDEALEWCHKTYKNKMLNTYGEVEVYKDILFFDEMSEIASKSEKILHIKL